MKKRIFSLLLAFAMLLSLLPTAALATGADESAAPAVESAVEPASEETTYVAQIGETDYATLADAIEAASEGDTILVTAVEIELPVITKAGLIFKANGTKVTNKLELTTSDSGWRLEGTTFDGFEFTQQASFVGKDMIFKNCKFTGNNGLYYGVSSGVWTIENCDFAVTGIYGLQFGSDAKGIVNVNNCIFYGGFNTYGIEMNFTDCTFNKGTAYSVLQTHAKMTLTDCTFAADWPTGTQGGHVGISGEVAEANGATVEIYGNTKYLGGSMFDLMEDKKIGLFAVKPTKDANDLYTGGTFNEAPAADKLAEGYVATENDDGTYTVAKEGVSSGITIDGTEVDSVGAAVDQIASNGGQLAVESTELFATVANNLSVRGSEKDFTVKVSQDDAAIIFDKDTILDLDPDDPEAADGAVALTIEKKEATADEPVIYTITLTIGDTEVTQLGGTATVTLPNPTESENVAVFYRADSTQDWTKFEGTVTATAGAVTFTTNHFTDWKVTTASVDTDATVWDGTTIATDWTGSGTEADPYVITTAAELAGLAADINTNGTNYSGKYFALGADIDLNNHNWTPIGYVKNQQFFGTFDGQGHKVKNLCVTTPAGSFTGLFGRVGSTGTKTVLKNITIENVNINYASSSYCAALAGNAQNTTIDNCDVIGTIYIYGHGTLAGIVAYPVNGTTITNCDVTGDITIIAEGSGYVGGIAAYSTVGSASIANCTVEDTADGGVISGPDTYVGGILGQVDDLTALSGCTVKNIAVSGSGYVGGIAGQAGTDKSVWVQNNTVTDCTVTATSGGSYVGTIAGSAYVVINNTVTDTTAYSGEKEIKQSVPTGGAALVGTQVTFNEDGTVAAGVFESKPDSAYIPDGFTAVQGEDGAWSITEGESGYSNWSEVADTAWYENAAADTTSYEISTAAQLAGLAQLVNRGENFGGKTVKLTAAIDLGTYTDAEGVVSENMAWTPIGTADHRFYGTFNGNSKTISNLRVTGTASRVGLFGMVGTSESPTTTITKVVVNNATIEGTNCVGVIVGESFGTVDITSCSVTGSISVSGSFYVGGIAGKSYANISSCKVTGTADAPAAITANVCYAGGIKGWAGEGSYTVKSNTVTYANITASSGAGGALSGLAAHSNIFTGNTVKNTNVYTMYTSDCQTGVLIGANNGNITDGPSYILKTTVTDTKAYNKGVEVLAYSGIATDEVTQPVTAVSVGTDALTESATGKVTYGTFQIVSDETLAEGAVKTDNGDGTFSVTVPNVMVTYEDGSADHFTTVSLAFTAVKNAAGATTITLLKDMTEKVTYSVSEGSDVTLDLGGYTLTSSGGSMGGMISNNGTLTIKNGTVKATSAGGNLRTVQNNASGVLTIESDVTLVKSTGTSAAYVLYNSGAVTMKGTINAGGMSAIYNAKDLTIDGATITTTGAGYIVRNSSGTLTVGSGTLTSSGSGYAIYNAGSKAVANLNGGTVSAVNSKMAIAHTGGTVNVNEGSTVKGMVFMEGSDMVLNVSGTIDATGTASSGVANTAIQTNGSSTENATVTIKEGAVVKADKLAVYFPSSGTFTVEGGSITGTTAIYMKSGTLNVTGGTITGTGEQSDYQYVSSGAHPTGDAIVIDNCGYPGGAPTATISGGTISSTNGVAIGAYYSTETDTGVSTGVTEIARITSTSTDLSAPEGYMWEIQDDGTAKLVETSFVASITVDGVTTKYESLQAAMDAAQDGETINIYAGTYDVFYLPKAANVKIVGDVNEDGTPAVTIQAQSGTRIAPNGHYNLDGEVSNIRFETVVDYTGPDFGALYLQDDGKGTAANATFTNCEFIRQGIHFAGVANFYGCTFDGQGVGYSAFNYCCPSGDIIVKDCTFSGYTFAAIHLAEGSANCKSVTIENCTVTSGENTPCYIELGQPTEVTFINGKIDAVTNLYGEKTVELRGTAFGENGKFSDNEWSTGDDTIIVYPGTTFAYDPTTGTDPVTPAEGYKIESSTDADGNTVYGVVVNPYSEPVCATIKGVEGKMTLSAALETAKTMTGDVVITLSYDGAIDLSGWTAAVMGTVKYTSLTINGNGCTITGLAQPLIGQTSAAGTSIIFKDLTFTDVNVTGVTNTFSAAAVLVAETLASCHIEAHDVTVSGGTISGGKYSGVFVGYSQGWSEGGVDYLDLVIDNCTVENINITSTGSVGAFIGHSYGKAIITNSYLKGTNSITYTGDDNDGKVGVMVGRISGGEVVLAVTDTSSTTLSPKGAVEGRIIGDLTDSGKATVNGGEYFVEPTQTNDSADAIAISGNLTNKTDENGATKYIIASVAVISDDGTTTNYGSLQKAFDNAPKGATIKLLGDIALTETVKVTTNLDDITLDGDGHTISVAANGISALYFGDKDTKLYATGVKIQNVSVITETETTGKYGIFFIGGDLADGVTNNNVLTNVTVEGSFTYGMVFNSNVGVTMNSCSVDNTNGYDIFTSSDRRSHVVLNGTVVNDLFINGPNATLPGVRVIVADGSTLNKYYTAYDTEEGCTPLTSLSVTGTGEVGEVWYNNGNPWIQYVVAEVNGTKYWSLAKAIDAAGNGQTVTLLDNCTISEMITIPAEKNITIDGKGFTVSRADGCIATTSVVDNPYNGVTMFWIEGKLTIKNLTIDAKGSAEASIIGVTVMKGQLDMYDSVIKGCYADAGSALFIDGTVNMYGGSIEGNGTSAASKGGIIWVYDMDETPDDSNAYFNMHSGKITGNTGGTTHQILRYHTNGYGYLNGEISGNSAQGLGGVLYFGSAGAERVTFGPDLVIENNTMTVDDKTIPTGIYGGGYHNQVHRVNETVDATGLQTKAVPGAAPLASAALKDEMIFCVTDKAYEFITRRTLLSGTDTYQLTEEDLAKVKVYRIDTTNYTYTDLANDPAYELRIIDNRIELIGLVTITFSATDAEPATQTVKVGAGLPLDIAAKVTVPTKSGYAFQAWYLSNGGYTFAADGTFHYTSDVTLTAKWEELTPVAAIGDVEYTTLQAAIDAAASGDKITLLKDLSEKGTEVEANSGEFFVQILDKDVTIDLGGYTFTGSFYLDSDAKLTIDNGNIVSLDGNAASCIESVGGSLVLGKDLSAHSSVRHAIRVKGGTAVINGGTYQTTAQGNITAHALNISHASTVTINGGTFKGSKGTSTATSGNAVMIQDNASTVNIYGGDFSNAIGIEGPVSVADGLTIYNGSFDVWYSGYDKFVTETKAVIYDAESARYILTDAVARIKAQNKSFGTLAEAIAAATNGQTVTLLANIELDEIVRILTDITLDMNGKTISSTATFNGAIIVVGNNAQNDPAKVTVTGNGTFDMAHTFALNVSYGDLTIENGTFKVYDTAVQLQNGTLTINGGSYEASSDATYLINILDKYNTTSTVTINGGSFKGFNPSCNTAEGQHTNFAAEGLIGQETDGWYTLVQGTYVAQTETQCFTTLAAAVAAAKDGQTIKLLADVTLDSFIRVNGTTVKIDLNGHTVSTNDVCAIFVYNGGKLELTGTGTVKENSPYYAPILFQCTDLEETAVITVGQDVTLEGWCGIMIDKGSSTTARLTVNMNGTIISKKDSGGYDGNGIYINGTVSNTEVYPTINVGATAVLNGGNGFGIHAAGYAVWNVEGTVSGASAIVVQTGVVNILPGAVITATGEKRNYTPGNNGADPTGDAILSDNCGYPGGVPTVNVFGGTITSTGEGTVAIGAYYGNTATEIGTVTANVDTLTAPAGYAWVEQTEGTYVLTAIYTVTVGEITNGEVSVNKTKAAAGETVTITVTAADGYELESLTVTDANGDAVTVTDNTFTMPASNVTVSATFKAVEESVELIEFYGTNVTLGNDLDLKFALAKSKIPTGAEGYYAKMTRTYSDGKSAVEMIVAMGDWKVDSTGNYYIFTYNGLAAKEMIDVVSVQIFDADGNAVSVLHGDSIKSYLTRRFEAVDNSEFKTLVVDALNYGAAAQTYFGYATDNLANKDLTEAQQALATQTFSVEDKLNKGTCYYGSNLTLESNIVFKIAYKFDNVDTSNLIVTVSFTNHLGVEENKNYSLKADGDYHILEITDLVVADMNQLVTITVKDVDGTVLDTTQDSMGGYLARNMDKAEVYGYVAKFCTAAYAYFH